MNSTLLLFHVSPAKGRVDTGFTYSFHFSTYFMMFLLPKALVDLANIASVVPSSIDFRRGKFRSTPKAIHRTLRRTVARPFHSELASCPRYVQGCLSDWFDLASSTEIR